MYCHSVFSLIFVISVYRFKASAAPEDEFIFDDDDFGFDKEIVEVFTEVRDELKREGYYDRKTATTIDRGDSRRPPSFYIDWEDETVTIDPEDLRRPPPLFIDWNDDTTEPPTEPEEVCNWEKSDKDPCNYSKCVHTMPTTGRTGRRVSERKCEELAWEYWTKVDEAERQTTLCTESLQSLGSQVAGGKDAPEGDFPHMGAVGWTLPNGTTRFLCGSSLISDNFALTAAHCWRATKAIYNERPPNLVRFGSVYIGSDNNEEFLTRDVNIKNIFVLEEFRRNNKSKYNDIALLELEVSPDEQLLSKLIRPACLWTGDIDFNWKANITGWGQLSARGPSTNHLQYGEVNFFEKRICKRFLDKRRNRHWPMGLIDHQFCAGRGSGEVDTCRGDSGGPIQIRRPMPLGLSGEVHYVIGVTSFGVECGLPQLPNVYINVTSFLCWIEKKVWPNEKNDFCP